ncbi:hypothetical protein [Segatella copri]|uniref:Uncharacterized protein n=1 Tax=Segatella copri DSM 18205 TaxID=537011 RepID=D1PGR0_9BACT|nr:hypothetical protein [Segatella copri]EFB34114.1 hypothetical protein PREVCOP_06423 [Segatella copri DSM 18205]MCW4097592.1 hypothetical protein [Segatella copri]MQP19977.1 hypothetical protein [Segatella copri DSM 18205]UEA42938.1 hypothetical protein LK433_13405 [Segatella copri DSM 18205]UWP52447.1 hypothetical protein NQ544_00585 [Segatella copri DSM 18205]
MLDARSAQSLFHRNLDRILTHFGDNQRLRYSIRGCTVGCNRRAEILAVSSEVTPCTLQD